MTGPAPNEHPLSRTHDLLQKAQGGDGDAANELFLLFRDPLERYLHAQLPHVVRSVQDTQDAVQEVMMRMYTSLGKYKYQGVGSLWGYLRKIARNYVLEQVREKKHWGGARGEPAVPAATTEIVAAQPSPHAHAQSREQFDLYESALAKLTPRTRNAFLLKWELKLEFAQIAKECGFNTADAARMAVTRAIQQMAEEMGERK